MKKTILLIALALITQINASSQSCLTDGITFSSQAQIDNFQTDYPNCSEIEGSVTILGSDISNLNGLSCLTTIGGHLSVGFQAWGNPLLTNLIGLDSIINIGGGLYIQNNENLLDLSGLNSLSNIGLDIVIWNNEMLSSISELYGVTSIVGAIRIYGNTNLTDLTGLNSLTAIGGDLLIQSNDSLTNLIGIGNIESGSISDLNISYNTKLSTCAVLSICNYLANPNGATEVHNNATGCNSKEEVEQACLYIGIQEMNSISDFLFYPNPAKEKIFIKSRSSFVCDKIIIYSQFGQKVLHDKNNTGIIDISTLRPGAYVVELVFENSVIRKTLIIEK